MTGGGSVRIASRGSLLALWQSRFVSDSLRRVDPDLEVRVEVIRTTGDKILDVPLARIGDRGLFTKEIDEALLDGRADLAVHSLKDIPTRIPDGLALAAVGERADPRDVLIAPVGESVSLDSLREGARVGTSSLRRRSQLAHRRPDLQIVDLRGNLDTRLAKLDAGEYDAIILAAAGIVRLGWDDRISQFLAADLFLPAVGQGALGIVCRADDTVTRRLIEPLHDPDTGACVTAERAFLRALEGGCQVPIGALARREEDVLHIDGFVADIDGSSMLRDTATGPAAEAARLGDTLAQALLGRGAAAILADVRASAAHPDVAAP